MDELASTGVIFLGDAYRIPNMSPPA